MGASCPSRSNRGGGRRHSQDVLDNRDPHFKGRARLRVVLVAAAAFLLYVWLGLPAVEVLLLAAVVGAFLPPALP